VVVCSQLQTGDNLLPNPFLTTENDINFLFHTSGIFSTASEPLKNQLLHILGSGMVANGCSTFEQLLMALSGEYV